MIHAGRRVTRAAPAALLVATVLLAAGCLTPRQPAPEVDAAAIQEFWGSFTGAATSGDVEVLTGLFTEDAVLLSPDGSVRTGREEIGRHLRGIFEAWRIESISLIHEEFEADRRWAHEWGRATEVVRPVEGGEPVEMEFRYLAVFERQPDRSWKLARLAEVVPGTPAPSEEAASPSDPR